MENSLYVYSSSDDSFNSINNTNYLKILLLGKGKSNEAVKNYYKNKKVIIDELEPKNKKEYYRFIKELKTYDICFRSPGIAINKSIYSFCNLLSKEFTNELCYALKNVKTKKIIVITGSNGKTSLCTLMYEILSVFNKTHLYGNIGKTLIDKLDTINEEDFLIVEASSFQLENLNCNVDVGIIKNLLPNHLNSTYSLSTYYASKTRLKLFSSYFIKDNHNKRIRLLNNSIYIDKNKLLNINELNINHPSFIEDILICLDVLLYYNLDYRIIKNVIKKHKLVKYRNEIIKYKNITFVNDGKSSTSSSSKYCFSLYKGKRILILGGIHKSNKFSFDFNNEDEVYIYGKDRYKIQKELNKGILYKTLDEILSSIKIEENITIIFSPGCASFDQFKNYEERSEVFSKWVNKWIK